MGAIIDYLWAVFYTKWAGMFALLVGIDEFLEWTVPRYRARLNRMFSQRTRRITLLVVFLIFAFVAGFLAWDDERVERLDESAKHLASEGVSKRELREAHEKIAKLESQPRIGEEAQAKIDSLTQTNRQLQQEVDALESQVKQQAAPWALTNDQKRKLAEALSRVPPGVTYELSLRVIPWCSTCSAYMADLWEVWSKMPGWKLEQSMDLGLNPRLRGIVVPVDMELCPAEELQLVKDALGAAGISYGGGTTKGRPGSGGSGCAVLIGSRVYR